MCGRDVIWVGKALGVVLLLAAGANWAWAQDSPQKKLEQELQTKLRGAVLVLLEPHIGPTLKYDLNGQSKNKSGLRGLSDEISVEKVEVRDHELVIAGTRLQDAYDVEKKSMVLSHSSVPVEVKIATANVSEAEVTKRFSQTFLLRSDLEKRKCSEYSYFEELTSRMRQSVSTPAAEKKKKKKVPELPDRESKEVCMPSGEFGWTVGRGTTVPHPTHDPDPHYPEGERQARVQGTVLMVIRLDENGVPSDGVLIKTPSAGFLQATSETVRSWKFTPILKDGNPVPAVFALEVNFHLM